MEGRGGLYARILFIIASRRRGKSQAVSKTGYIRSVKNRGFNYLLTEMTEMIDCEMQTTLRIDDDVYREAKADAARSRLTITRYIEEALKSYARTGGAGIKIGTEAEERNRLMEALLKKTAHFRIGEKPTREQMNER